MRFGKKLIAAAAASLMMMGTASADWNGLYAGVYTGPVYTPGGGPVFQYNVGAQAGFNFVRGNFVLGLGFDAGPGLIGGGAAIFCCTFSATIRAGALISPDVLLYALAGAGSTIVPGATMGTIFGLGAELAIGEKLGVFAEVRRGTLAFGQPPASAFPSFRLGLNIHQ